MGNFQPCDPCQLESVAEDETTQEINDLDAKKSGTFMDIPVKRLKEVVDIVAEPL